MRTIEESMEVVKQWVDEREPDRFETMFGRPATAKKLERFETILGRKLPDDLAELYRIHDGMLAGSVFSLHGYHWSSLQKLGSDWSTWHALLEVGDIPTLDEGNREVTDPRILSVWWSPGWLPFMHDFGGNHHCYDLTPGEQGECGQIITMDHEVGGREIIASSLRAYLDEFATDLLQGFYDLTEFGINSNRY